MNKLAFLFPGVGAQYVGMCRSLYDNFAVFKETLQEAGDILGMDVADLSFSPGRKEELDRLENAQCVLVAFSTAVYRVYMQEVGIPPSYCMGHSLGEYSALCCSGVIDFPDALRLVKERGLIVQGVSARIDGTMAWVINLDNRVVEEVCRQASTGEQKVVVSAYDSPSQSSISGHKERLMSAGRELEKRGAIVYPLQLSGPFHSPLMVEAAERMKEVLGKYTFKKPEYPVIANHNARPYAPGNSVADNLSLQLISPIRWQESIRYLLDQGVTTAVEIGPKDVLKFLMEKNTDKIVTFTTDNDRDLELLGKGLILDENEYLGIIGKCLGAAVSTKNRNEDEQEYEEKVVRPYRRVEAFYNEFLAGGDRPRKQHVKEAVQMLCTVLEAKKEPEQDFWLRRVLGNKFLY